MLPHVPHWRFVSTVVLAAGVACSGPSPRPTPPEITSQPFGQTVATCDAAGFAVQATGSPPLTYEWQRDGVPIRGANGDAYLIAAAIPADAGTYSVVVTNAAGTARSREVSLTVTGAPSDPPGPVVLAQEGGVGLAIDSATIAWTGSGYGYVHAARLPCGKPVRSVYERGSIYNAPSRALLAGGDVYWVDGGSGGVWRGYTDGRPAIMLAQAGIVTYSLARAGDRLYWTDPRSANIQSMPLAGGDVTTISVGAYPTNGPNGIATDDLYVYWNDVYEQTVKRMPLGGGLITVLASGQGYLAGIAADGQQVYWASTDTVAGTPTGSVRSVGRDGGIPQILASQEGVQAIAVAVDTAYAYWTADPLAPQTQGKGLVGRVRPDGTGGAIIASGLSPPYGLALDDKYVYWVEDPTAGGAGRVVRMKK